MKDNNLTTEEKQSIDKIISIINGQRRFVRVDEMDDSAYLFNKDPKVTTNVVGFEDIKVSNKEENTEEKNDNDPLDCKK